MLDCFLIHIIQARPVKPIPSDHVFQKVHEGFIEFRSYRNRFQQAEMAIDLKFEICFWIIKM